MKLWIGNIAPGTPDEEVRAFVKKYAPDLECTKIQHVEGDGSRPAAVRSQADSYTQIVNVYSAVGGGWVNEANKLAPQPTLTGEAAAR